MGKGGFPLAAILAILPLIPAALPARAGGGVDLSGRVVGPGPRVAPPEGFSLLLSAEVAPAAREYDPPALAPDLPSGLTDPDDGRESVSATVPPGTVCLTPRGWREAPHPRLAAYDGGTCDAGPPGDGAVTLVLAAPGRPAGPSGGDPTYVVNNTADSGPGSLRWALSEAASDGLPSRITFDLPETDPGYNGTHWVIHLSSPLTVSGEATDLDGTTQAGYSGSPVVVIDGSSLSWDAVTVAGDNGTISGIAVVGPPPSGGFNYACLWVNSGVENLTVRSSVFRGPSPPTGSGASRSYSCYYGIFLDDHSEGALIEGSTFRWVDRGIMARRYYHGERAPVIRACDFEDVAYGVKLYGVARGSSVVLVEGSTFNRSYYYGVYSYVAAVRIENCIFEASPVYWMPDWWTWTSAVGLVGTTSAVGWYDVVRPEIRRSTFIQGSAEPPPFDGGTALCGYFSDPLVTDVVVRQEKPVQAVMIRGGTGYDPSIPSLSRWTLRNVTLIGFGPGGQSHVGVLASGGGYGMSGVEVISSEIENFTVGVRLWNPGGPSSRVDYAWIGCTRISGCSDAALSVEDDSRNVTVNRSRFESSGVGVRVSPSASDVLIYDDVFDCVENSEDPAGAASWYVSPRPGPNVVGGPWIAGSWWSDYLGSDLDGDWLGDTDLPHRGDVHPLLIPPDPAKADLEEVELTYADPGGPPVSPGDELVFSVLVVNSGSLDALANLTLRLPPGLTGPTFVSPPPGAVNSSGPGLVSVLGISVPAGSSAAVTFGAQVSAPSGSSVPVQGWVTYSEVGCGCCAGAEPTDDPTTPAPDDPTVVEVAGAASLRIEVSGIPPSASVEVYVNGSPAGTVSPGSPLDLSLDPGWVEVDVGSLSVGPGTRLEARWCSVNGTRTARPASLRLERSALISFNFSAKHRVEAVSRFGSVRGAGWYWAGSRASVCVSPTEFEGPTVRAHFRGWSGFPVGSRCASFRVVSPTRLTALWRVDYLVEVDSPFGRASGAGWYPEGSVAEIRVPGSVPLGPGSRAVFSRWAGDAEGSSPTLRLVVDSPKRISAIWSLEHLVVVSSDPPGGLNLSEWVPAGETFSFEAPAIMNVSGSPCAFSGWSGSVSSQERRISLVVDGPKRLVASCSRWASVEVRTSPALPIDLGIGRVEVGSEVCVEAPEFFQNESGVRWRFSGWEGFPGEGREICLTALGRSTLTATYSREYLVRVEAPGELGPFGSGWYPEGAEAEVGVSATTAGGEGGARIRLLGWETPSGSRPPVRKIRIRVVGPTSVRAVAAREVRVSIEPRLPEELPPPSGLLMLARKRVEVRLEEPVDLYVPLNSTIEIYARPIEPLGLFSARVLLGVEVSRGSWSTPSPGAVRLVVGGPTSVRLEFSQLFSYLPAAAAASAATALILGRRKGRAEAASQTLIAALFLGVIPLLLRTAWIGPAVAIASTTWCFLAPWVALSLALSAASAAVPRSARARGSPGRPLFTRE